MSYILAIDQGTTSTRALLYDANGEVLALSQEEIHPHFPFPGWVEQDPEEIIQSVERTCRDCIQKSGISARQILGIGISNQRETSILWDRRSGKPIYPAIVWQSRQSAAYIDKLIQRGLGEAIRQKTGLIPDAYFSASKNSWILDKGKSWKKAAGAGEILFGTVDSWIL